MSEQTVYLTREGYEKLQSELEHLTRVRRQEVARRLHEALGEGELLENAELEDARNEQAFVEGRILELETLLSKAEVIQGAPVEGVVGLGSQVTIAEEGGPPETYHIVGSAEAAPAEGKISYESPIGKALMGRAVGDQFTVHAPGGLLTFRIVEIQ